MATVSWGEGRDGPFSGILSGWKAVVQDIHCWVSISFTTTYRRPLEMFNFQMLRVLALGLALGIWRKLGEHVVGMKQDKREGEEEIRVKTEQR